MMRSAIVARPLTRFDRAKICGWVRHVKEHLRARRRGERDDHLVRGDDDLSEAIVDYLSIAYDGWTWPGEERLAEILNESDHNIRKRVARLRKAKLLVVISPSDGWHSNRYIPVLNGRPLFEVALTSETVRDAIAALHCDAGTPPPPEDTPESGTPVPPEEVKVVQGRRNALSAEPSRNNAIQRDCPTPCPAPEAGATGPPREGETLAADLQEKTFRAPPQPASTPRRAGNSTEPYESEVRAQPARAEPATAPVVEFSFACLVRDYPRPQGGHQPIHQAELLNGNFRVASLEGIRAFVRFNAFSDKAGPFCAFDSKQLMGAVRMMLPHSTLSALPESTRQLAPRSRASGGDRKSPLQ
jgi:hypothetical protein